ncbi:TRNA-specific adenosine deaminase [Geobacillus sp. WSUCF1]|nr:TRNA-specific adenosine deaminase [Geobacillus sp. WSUCF1]
MMNLLQESRFNHQVKVVSGVLADECGSLLSQFFRRLREQKRNVGGSANENSVD